MPSQLEFLRDTQQFLQQYEDFLTGRIKGLENDALGDSRYISQWLSYVIRENAKQSKDKVATTYQQLPNAFFKQHYLGFLNRLPTLATQSIYAVWQWLRPSDPKLTQAVDKATEYLARARDALAEQQWVTEYSNRSIPVRPHQKELEKVQACTNALLALIHKYPKELGSVSAEKTWVNKTLGRMRDFVKLRVISFAIREDRQFKGWVMPKATVTPEQAIMDMNIILNSDLAKQKKPGLPETSLSKNLHRRNEEPIEADFLPNAKLMTQAFRNLRTLLNEKKEKAAFSEVDETLTVDYPKHSYTLK